MHTSDSQSTLTREPPPALCATSTSHLALRVRDVARSTAFYERALGLSVQERLGGSGLRLGWGRGHHVVDLLDGKPALDHFAFAVDDRPELTQIRARASSCGVYVSELSDEMRADGIELLDPDSNRVQFHLAGDRSGEFREAGSDRPIRLQHITLATDNMGPTASFYCDVLGFRRSDVLGDNELIWLRSNRDHHTLALVDSGRRAVVDYFAFDVNGRDEFEAWCDHLSDEDVRITWGPDQRGPGNNLFLFFDDPDGNHIELSAARGRFSERWFADR
jgi:catechol-2,3-dioxygenase